MRSIVKAYYKHLLRNKTKEPNQIFLSMGQVGKLLISPITELITFILIFSFIQTVAIGITLEKGYTSHIFGVNPVGVIIGFVISFIYYDSYSENSQTQFNKWFLKLIPKSSYYKYFSLFLLEIIGVKVFSVFSVVIAILTFNYFNHSDIISYLQFINFFILLLTIYLSINSVFLLVKIIWKIESKLYFYFINYGSIFFIAISAERLFSLFERIQSSSLVIISICILFTVLIHFFIWFILEKLLRNYKPY